MLHTRTRHQRNSTSAPRRTYTYTVQVYLPLSSGPSEFTLRKQKRKRKNYPPLKHLKLVSQTTLPPYVQASSIGRKHFFMERALLTTAFNQNAHTQT